MDPEQNTINLSFHSNSPSRLQVLEFDLLLLALAMPTIMPERDLQFVLEAAQSLPIHICWRVCEGYIRATGKTDFAEVFTLGIWGPGEIVIPELLNQQPVELRALSSARVHACEPDTREREHCSSLQIHQMGKLLQLTRIRPAEARLFNVLIWLAERFGTNTGEGRSVPINGMNLTHQQLAEMASVSRVTVTKALGHFREQGWLIRIGDTEVLTQLGQTLIQELRYADG